MTEQDDPTAAPASIEDVLECDERANALVRGFLGRLMRQQRSIAVAVDYVLALGRDVRANCWDLAERAGHGGPHRMQALLRSYRWSWERGREMLPGLAQQALGDDPGDEIGPGIAVDETADLKSGTATACVSPQHAGVTGRVENCVTWVFAALVTARDQAWAWFDLYMPEETWAKDRERRETAGIPEGLAFATKPALAIAQVRKLVSLGLRFCRVAADETTFRTGKDAFGWDQSQARTWDALSRHILLTALAQIRAIICRDTLTRESGNRDSLPAAEPAPAAQETDSRFTDADLLIYQAPPSCPPFLANRVAGESRRCPTADGP